MWLLAHCDFTLLKHHCGCAFQQHWKKCDFFLKISSVSSAMKYTLLQNLLIFHETLVIFLLFCHSFSGRYSKNKSNFTKWLLTRNKEFCFCYFWKISLWRKFSSFDLVVIHSFSLTVLAESSSHSWGTVTFEGGHTTSPVLAARMAKS